MLTSKRSVGTCAVVVVEVFRRDPTSSTQLVFSIVLQLRWIMIPMFLDYKSSKSEQTFCPNGPPLSRTVTSINKFRGAGRLFSLPFPVSIYLDRSTLPLRLDRYNFVFRTATDSGLSHAFPSTAKQSGDTLKGPCEAFPVSLRKPRFGTGVFMLLWRKQRHY